ncbi:MAG: hypothetical protein PHW21_00905 [Candidatus Izemoplasmatales bacterium]|jgi:cation transport ATPase|nr:hypothetical protein [Candidatus Izemoplasmatales bacterium]MDY0138368.1 hypothetical protein [Candidatus Izemoplasmatales bacterium]
MNNKYSKEELDEIARLLKEAGINTENERKNTKRKDKPKKKKSITFKLGFDYSANLYVNLIINFIVNFVVFFLLVTFFGFVYIASVFFAFLIALIVTLWEELYKKYITEKFLYLISFSSGLVFFLMNLLLFYFLDLVIFGSNFYFYDQWYVFVFVIYFQILKSIVKTLYVYFHNKVTIKRLIKRR